ncbi:mitochondrial resolvase Ydc2 [Coniella lustricola]|uniref:Mitochondrial resolvase Ydc2 n=1 Tax=Coniella lustricola TaxID=2025994 RepID=A0A2T3AGM2_9PEZI|nr:mitochondrial resolvase Ydc2 [Coniella lustricola]
MITLARGFQAHHLKQVARLVGASRTGSKGAIVDRLNTITQDFKPLTPGTRILSIDLGIRNLAYSLLEIPPEGFNQPPSDAALALAADSKAATLVTTKIPPPLTKKQRKEKEAARRQKLALGKVDPPPVTPPPGVVPTLCAWERLALIPKALVHNDLKAKAKARLKESRTSTASGKKINSKMPAAEDQDGDTDPYLIASTKDAVPTTLLAVEDFSPGRLAELAVDLITTRLLPLKPDIILLEQQRFRSQGGDGVFEWTLRVNTLESMLYAIFTTLQRLGHWSPNGRLESVVSRNVLEFMAVYHSGGVEDASKIWSKTSRDDNKKIKKNIVGRMLRDGGGVSIDQKNQQVKDTSEHYLNKWQAQAEGKRAAPGTAEAFKKLDDLADSLLQGLAYIKWQENKAKLLDQGMESLRVHMVDELLLRFGIEKV